MRIGCGKEEEAEEAEWGAEEADGRVEERGERRETPKACRREQQRDWAIAVAFLKRDTHLAG